MQCQQQGGKGDDHLIWVVGRGRAAAQVDSARWLGLFSDTVEVAERNRATETM